MRGKCFSQVFINFVYTVIFNTSDNWSSIILHFFFRSLAIRNETKKTLAENDNVINYMAQKLNCTHEDILYMVHKNPTFDSIRVTKVKKKSLNKN